MMNLPEDQMPEAEVALRLAFWLLSLPDAELSSKVAIDGMQARHFPVRAFLKGERWRLIEPGGRGGSSTYQGTYQKGTRKLKVHAEPGVGDVVVSVGEARILAECKGGPLSRSKEGKERTNLVAAVGQLACARLPDGALPVAAVPASSEFRRLVGVISEDTIAAEAGIKIALVNRDGAVEGLW